MASSATNPTKFRTDLKDIFNGLSTLYFTKEVADLDGATGKAGTIAINWDYELPVTVDTLQISQDDPTINHYKVIGLQGDWASSSESGDFTIQFTVPSKATDVLKLAFGEDATAAVSGTTSVWTKPAGGSGNATETKTNWTGTSVTVNQHKISGTIGLLDESGENLMLISNIALYAKPMYENASTEPFAVQFSGSIETSGDANFAWLKKA